MRVAQNDHGPLAHGNPGVWAVVALMKITRLPQRHAIMVLSEDSEPFGDSVGEVDLENDHVIVPVCVCRPCAANVGLQVAEADAPHRAVCAQTTDTPCPGSLGPPTDDPRDMTDDGLPGGTCPECGNLVETQPPEPGGPVRRLESHSPVAGTTLRVF